jgi:hypothetical protein
MQERDVFSKGYRISFYSLQNASAAWQVDGTLIII